MSLTSTGLLPRLERLVLDNDVNRQVQDYLKAVGFDVTLITQADVDVRDDVAILSWARSEGRFLLCHDKHRDRET